MKLIDILVEELPKSGGWDAKWHQCAQDGNGEVCFFTSGEIHFRGIFDAWSIPPDSVSRHDGKDRLEALLADDYSETIITREQYEAALAAKNEGWIDWGGGECPVSDSTIVEVRYRNGEVKAAAPAYFYEWGHWRPHFVTTGCDIIAYRLHKPLEAEQAKADDETDLNECIGQDAAPVWNGEGLPPVGVECEYSWAGEPWASGVIRYISKHTIIIETQADSTGDTECAYHPTDIKLRPFRTEAERKRDEAVEAIDRYMPEFIPDTPNDYYNAKKIYDAIAAGKIPGVKLED